MATGECGRARRVRILIAEDQALVRRGTTVLLSMEQDMEVVGQACDGVEAVAKALELRPDVVLMDLHMPRLGGVAAARENTPPPPAPPALGLPPLNADPTGRVTAAAGPHRHPRNRQTAQ